LEVALLLEGLLNEALNLWQRWPVMSQDRKSKVLLHIDGNLTARRSAKPPSTPSLALPVRRQSWHRR
jgi:hypothetical protein